MHATGLAERLRKRVDTEEIWTRFIDIQTDDSVSDCFAGRIPLDT